MLSQKVGIAVVKDRGGLAVLREAVELLRNPKLRNPKTV